MLDKNFETPFFSKTKHKISFPFFRLIFTAWLCLDFGGIIFLCNIIFGLCHWLCAMFDLSWFRRRNVNDPWERHEISRATAFLRNLPFDELAGIGADDSKPIQSLSRSTWRPDSPTPRFTTQPVLVPVHQSNAVKPLIPSDKASQTFRVGSYFNL